MVEILLTKGPWGVNEQGVETGWTPLHSLAIGGVKKLKQHYREFNELIMWHKPKNPPTTMSERTYDPKGTAQALIRAGADWNITGWLAGYHNSCIHTAGNIIDKELLDPVVLAAVAQNFEVAESLLSLGADPVMHHIKKKQIPNEGVIGGGGGGKESVPPRLSEIAARTGQPPRIQAMVTVLKALALSGSRDMNKGFDGRETVLMPPFKGIKEEL